MKRTYITPCTQVHTIELTQMISTSSLSIQLYPGEDADDSDVYSRGLDDWNIEW